MTKKMSSDKVGTETISLVVQIDWKLRPPKHAELGLPQRPSRIMLSKEGQPFQRVDVERHRSAEGQFLVAIAGKGGSEGWGVDLVAWRD